MNRNVTIGLVVVAVLLGAYVLLVQRPRDLAGDATPTTRVTEYVWTLTADEVSGVRLEDLANDRAVELTKDSAGAWTLVEPGPQAADQTAVTSGVSGLASLTVNTNLTSTTDLTAFGVLSPTYRLTVRRADGWNYVAVIGDKVPTGTSYYVLRDGETTALTVNAFALETVFGWLDTPPVVPPTATPEATLTPEGAGTPNPEATVGDITPEPDVTATP